MQVHEPTSVARGHCGTVTRAAAATSGRVLHRVLLAARAPGGRTVPVSSILLELLLARAASPGSEGPESRLSAGGGPGA